MARLDFIVKNFLKKTGYLEQPLLLALSGGPDSTALFYLLLQAKVSFEVAHVDHRWRATSQQEAEQLQKLCQQHHITFHLATLQIEVKEANLEDRCRQKRLLFFKEILESQGLKAVLCAHHADDQAETVLKRALEGSSLVKLSALQPVKIMKGMVILRPLLKITKREILDWLERKKVAYFIDQTNEDSKFLRGRMRSEMIPALSEVFGKNIQKGLCHLAQSAAEFAAYLEECLGPILQSVREIDSGYQLFFPKEILASSFLCKMALKRFFGEYEIYISNELLDIYTDHLQMSKKKKTEYLKGYCIELDGDEVKIIKLLQ